MNLKPFVSATCAFAVAAGLLSFSPAAYAAGDAKKGKEVFEQCSACHNADTDEKKMGPALKGLFKKDKLKSGKAVSEASVRDIIEKGGNGMPPYADMLEKGEKDNLIAYLKTI